MIAILLRRPAGRFPPDADLDETWRAALTPFVHDKRRRPTRGDDAVDV